VTVIFQHDADDAYVTLIGAATLRESASEVRRRWKAAYRLGQTPTSSSRSRPTGS